MPKFDPRQQQKKLRRHNPIAKSSTGSASGTQQQKSRANGTQHSNKLPDDAIPLLAHLPLPPSHAGATGAHPPSSLDEDERRHRALLGLNPLLLSKSSRVALLAPQHQLLQRLLHHLNHPRLEVRKEAAGCLRNLCVQGKWTGREQIWKLGGGATALAQVEYAARELDLLPRAQGSAPQLPAETTSAPKKPEEMNRKERRLAAKAAAKKGNLEGSQDVPAHVMATPASAAAEADAHDLHLLHLSLLENHLTILWCLLESVSSPVWLIALNRSPLGDLLIAAISQGAQTFHSQSTLPAVGKADAKEQKEIQAAQLEVAFTAANLLAAWLEDSPAGCASIAGLPADLTEQVIAFEQAGSSAQPGTKSRKRLDAILDKFGGEVTDNQMKAARKRIDRLASAVESLSDTALTSPSDIERVNLALLSLASCCNLLSPLPSAIRSCVPAPSSCAGASDVQTLTQWHTRVATPLLLAFLQANGQQDSLWQKADTDAKAARDGQADADAKPQVEIVEDGSMDVDGKHVREDADVDDEEQPVTSNALRFAETLTLAVDLLGEICTEAEAEELSVNPASISEGPSASVNGDEMDEDRSEDDEDADSLTSEQEEEMLMLAEADRGGAGNDEDDAEATDADGDMSMSTTTTGGGKTGSSKAQKRRKIGFAANPYATLTADLDVTSTLLDSLDKSLSAAMSSAETSASSEFSLAACNTLAALLSGLASHAHPPPTHPLEEGSRQERRVDQFIAWVSDNGDRLKAIWSRLAVSASQITSHKSLLPLSVPIWTSLDALMVCYEGVESPLPYQIDTVSLKSFFGSSLDHYLSISASTSASEEDTQNATETSSLILSLLAYLARVNELPGTTHLERVAFSTSTYLTLLLSGNKSVPLKVTVTALNALIDTFSDEESAWDVVVFRNGQGVQVNNQVVNGSLLHLLKSPAVVTALKDKIRAVDARKSEGNKLLKEEADEALENFRAWLAFRESVQ